MEGLLDVANILFLDHTTFIHDVFTCDFSLFWIYVKKRIYCRLPELCHSSSQ